MVCVCVCVGAESVTRGVLNDFLATYGKSADAEKEEGRLGQSHSEYAAGIITDYGLPLTVEEYSEAIFPLCLKRFLPFWHTDQIYIVMFIATHFLFVMLVCLSQVHD